MSGPTRFTSTAFPQPPPTRSDGLRLTLDGEPHPLSPGDVAIAPAGSTLKFDNLTDAPATIWVTTSLGLEGVFPDGSRVSPPWVR